MSDSASGGLATGLARQVQALDSAKLTARRDAVASQLAQYRFDNHLATVDVSEIARRLAWREAFVAAVTAVTADRLDDNIVIGESARPALIQQPAHLSLQSRVIHGNSFLGQCPGYVVHMWPATDDVSALQVENEDKSACAAKSADSTSSAATVDVQRNVPTQNGISGTSSTGG